MSHSNSSLNCFVTCQRKYYHNYVAHTPSEIKFFPHLEFGSMAHEVLEKAGHLRDNAEAGVEDYNICIPSEVYREDLKEYFGIKNWYTYFTTVCRQIAKYEKELISELGTPIIERELKLSMSPEEMVSLGLAKPHEFTEPLVGVIDLLLYTKDAAIIIDYKFSTTKKTQDDFDMNSQLYLYALMIHFKYNIPVHNIQIGYIDIPKKDFAMPVLLTNGTLSRAKSQNVSQEMYINAVKILHPTNWEQMIGPGGYYHDIVNELALNKPAYLQKQYIEVDAMGAICNDLLDTASRIELIKRENLPYLAKYNSYSCKGCEYLHACKPWLGVNHE